MPARGLTVGARMAYLDPDRALSLGKEAGFLKGTAGKK
jgi:hypothetical protein